MKVVGLQLDCGVGERGQASRFNVNYVVLILQGALDQEEFAARYHQAVTLVEVGSDDDVRNARFVFH